MRPDDICEELREQLPELALGIATGEERARALGHLAHCPECRVSLREMSDVADDLLLAAPEREPPVGFETRVVEQLFGRNGRRWGRILGGAAVVVALMAVSALAVLLATKSDRDLADSYRETLSVAQGEYFTASTLRAAARQDAGTVFGYQGAPSWVFLLVEAPGRSGSYEISVGTEDGRRITVGDVTVRRGVGTWGGAIPVDFHELADVKLRARRDSRTLWAEL